MVQKYIFIPSHYPLHVAQGYLDSLALDIPDVAPNTEAANTKLMTLKIAAWLLYAQIT